MPSNVAFHFLLLAAGEVLKQKESVNPLDIQNYINQDTAFGVRVPLEECRLALWLLGNSGFIIKSDSDSENYERWVPSVG